MQPDLASLFKMNGGRVKLLSWPWFILLKNLFLNQNKQQQLCLDSVYPQLYSLNML